MNEFVTEKGTSLFWEVTYSLGGYNHFNGNQEPRGYSLSIRRKRNEFAAFSDLADESGAVRMFLLEVGRRSKKREAEAVGMVTEDYLQEIADRYDI